MSLSNYDDKQTLNPINNMLIDKPQLKPIDLLVERPPDTNAGRSNRLTQPIVQRFIDEPNSTYEEESRSMAEPIIKPAIKPSARIIKDNKPASRILAEREREIESVNENKRRPFARKKLENLDEFPVITHLLDELDNPDVVAKIKTIINETASNSPISKELAELTAPVNKELEIQNQNLREQNRAISEQNRAISEQSRTISDENRSLVEQNRSLNERNHSLTEQLDTALMEVTKLKKIAINLKKEKNEYMNKNGSLLDEHKKIASKVQKFEYDQNMFRLFTSLNQEVKSSLRGIFKVDTYENFIACGAQRSNIDSLWDFAKNRVQKQQFDEIETLNQILLYFIDIFNQTSNSPTIKIQEVAIGTNFDTEAHIKSSDSVKPAGTINKIYLIGYQNYSNDKILNKAIVLIGG